jgi:hypothetical protein
MCGHLRRITATLLGIMMTLGVGVLPASLVGHSSGPGCAIVVASGLEEAVSAPEAPWHDGGAASDQFSCPSQPMPVVVPPIATVAVVPAAFLSPFLPVIRQSLVDPDRIERPPKSRPASS